MFRRQSLCVQYNNLNIFDVFDVVFFSFMEYSLVWKLSINHILRTLCHNGLVVVKNTLELIGADFSSINGNFQLFNCHNFLELVIEKLLNLYSNTCRNVFALSYIKNSKVVTIIFQVNKVSKLGSVS